MTDSVSTAGRRYGHEAACAALRETPRVSSRADKLSRISERSNESKSSGKSNKSKKLDGGDAAAATDGSIEKVKATAKRAMNNKFAVAGIVFMLTFVLLCVLAPPMAQNAASQDNPTAPPTRSWQKILVWSSLAAVVALLLPFGMSCLVKKAE